MRAPALAALVLSVPPALAESVDVKDRGPVDLKPFTCVNVERSSVITRVCCDEKEKYLIIRHKQAYYHNCELNLQIYAEFLAALSMGNYYDKHIKGTGKDGPFDCRTHRVPSYK